MASLLTLFLDFIWCIFRDSLWLRSGREDSAPELVVGNTEIYSACSLGLAEEEEAEEEKAGQLT